MDNRNFPAATPCCVAGLINKKETEKTIAFACMQCGTVYIQEKAQFK